MLRSLKLSLLKRQNATCIYCYRAVTNKYVKKTSAELENTSGKRLQTSRNVPTTVKLLLWLKTKQYKNVSRWFTFYVSM